MAHTRPVPAGHDVGDVPYRMTGPELVGEVPAGFPVRLYLLDGTRVEGDYTAAGRLPRSRYEPAYAAWRGDHPDMPALGDTVTLALRQDDERVVVFDGFGYRTLEYVDPADQRRAGIARDSVEAIGGASRPRVALAESTLTRVPVWTAMRIAGSHRDTTVVGLAEIDSIWAPRQLNPTATDQAVEAVAVAGGVTAGVLLTIALVTVVLAALVSMFTLGQGTP